MFRFTIRDVLWLTVVVGLFDCTHDDLLEDSRSHLLAAVIDVPKVATLAANLLTCADEARSAGDVITSTALERAATELERRLGELAPLANQCQ